MSFLTSLLNVLVVISSLFLICLVLIQRGKGGGLAGAFGGAGGSSAFGTKAGDVFTKITMITALIWIVMLMFLVILSNRGSDAFPDTPLSSSTSKSTSAAGGGARKDAAPLDTELVPPPPSGVGGSSSAKGTATTGVPAPAIPPVSSSGPSAPLPVSPAPESKSK